MQSFPRFACFGFVVTALAGSNVALAQSSPYYLGIGQAVSHENNLFRSRSGQPEESDSYWTTSVVGGIDRPVGRQRLYGDAAVRYSKYQDNSQLDNTSYGLNAALDWATIERLSGTLSYALNENLARYGADSGPTITDRNMERTQEFLAKAQLGVVSLLSLETQYVHRQIDYSASEFAFQEFKQDAGSLGVVYRPSGLLRLGLAYRATRGRYPAAIQPAPGVNQEDKFDRDDVDLTATWIPTGLSTVTARLSYTKEDHSQLVSRDYSGNTGAIGWEYKPTGKLTFITDLIYDTGAEGAFSQATAGNPGSGITPSGNLSRLSKAVQLRAQWDATAKIKIDGLARYVKRDLVSTFALANGGSSVEDGSDKFALFSLGGSYVPTRNWRLGCDFAYEKRASSSSVSYPYTANKVSCSGQFTLQ